MSNSSSCCESPPSPQNFVSNGLEGEATYSEYSDDFESHCDSVSETPSLQKRRRWRRSPRPASKSGWFGNGIRKLGFWKTRRKVRNRRSPGDGKVISKILQANQQKIAEIEDKLFNTERRFETVRKENRILKTLQHKQEKVIRTFDDRKSELPCLISQHAEEQRALRFRLKRARAAERNLEVKVRENNNSLLKMDETLQRLKQIISEKELEGRSKLAKHLAEKERNLDLAERKIEKLNKQIELVTHSFLRQINSEKRKNKETQKKLEDTEKERVSTQSKLHEKERALGNKNIYALRKKDSQAKRKTSTSSAQTQNMDTSGTLKREPVSSTELQYIPEPSAPQKSNVESSDGRVQSSDQMQVEEVAHTRGTPPVENQDFYTDTPTSAIPCHKGEKSPGISPVISRKTSEVILANAKKPTSEHVTPNSYCGQEDQRPVNRVDTTSTNEIPSSVFVTAKFDTSFPTVDSSNYHKTSNLCKISTENPCNHFTDPKKTTYSNKRNDVQEMNNDKRIDLNSTKGHSKEFEVPAEILNIRKHCQEKEDQSLDEKKTLWREPEKYEVEKTPKKSYQFSKEIQNLHLGIPSSIERCKKKMEKLENDILYFGSYSPTVGGEPTRRKYLPVREYNSSISEATTKEEMEEPSENRLKGTKESELLMRLFGKLEIEKDRLLGDEPQVHFSTAAPTSPSVTSPRRSRRSSRNNSTAIEFVWLGDSTNDTKLNGDGDSLDIHLKPFTHFDGKDFAVLDDDIEDRPA